MASTSLPQLQVDNSFGDQFRQHPDEILLCILSRLPIKDAVRTSVLSTRWRNLWKLTSCLNFDTSKLSSLGRSKYVTLVNEVLRLHERPHLDEIRIRFALNAGASRHIDKWMKFMILKRAKRIEIDLSRGQHRPSPEFYQHLKSPSNLSNIMCLESLTLMSVDVDGGSIEYLLSKCLHLETLSISCSRTLSSLRVAGPSLPLKYLKIYRCVALQTIELSAPNLETFVYCGSSVQFVFGNNPVLSKLYLGDASSRPGGLEAVTDALCFFSRHFSPLETSHLVGLCAVADDGLGLGLFSSYFSQLETLSLTMALHSSFEIPRAVGPLSNLKHLILAIHVKNDVSLFGFTRLLHAAPLLEKLKLQLNVLSPEAYDFDDRRFNLLNNRLECLKEVEICWYYGGWCDFEIAKYVAIYAINLEKMVLDTRWDPGLRKMDDFDRIVQPINMRDQVEELEEILRPRAKLIVLA